MNKCSYCNHKLDSLPKACKFCGEIHCTKHLLPENHKCKSLEEWIEYKKNKWQSDAQNVILKAHYKARGKDYDEEIEYPEENSQEIDYRNLKYKRPIFKTHDSWNIPIWIRKLVENILIFGGIMFILYLLAKKFGLA